MMCIPVENLWSSLTQSSRKEYLVKRESTVCIHGDIFFPVYMMDAISTRTQITMSEPKTAFWNPNSLEGRPTNTRTFGHPIFLRLARQWIVDRARYILESPAVPTIVYTKRSHSTSNNGRLMDEQNELLLIQSLQHKLQECARLEKLVILMDMTKMGIFYRRRISLYFHSASLVVGPHGGAFTNVLLMPPVSPNFSVETS